MKKIILILFGVAIIFNFAYSQIEKPITKGNIQIGGSFYSTFSTENKDDYSNKSSSITLNPMLGYFIADGFVIGAAPNFSYSWNNSDTFSSKAFSINVGPYTKYYFLNGVMVHMSTGYQYSISNQSNEDYKRKSTSFRIESGIGYALFINNKISLESLIKHVYLSREDQGNRNLINLDFGFQIFI